MVDAIEKSSLRIRGSWAVQVNGKVSRWGGFRRDCTQELHQWHGGLVTYSLGSDCSVLVSFLDSMCWQEIASRGTSLHYPRFKSSRKRHPCCPGPLDKSGFSSDCLWLEEHTASHRGPENAVLRLAGLSQGGVLCSLKNIWILLSQEHQMCQNGAQRCLPLATWARADHVAPLSRRGLTWPMGMLAHAQLPPELL